MDEDFELRFQKIEDFTESSIDALTDKLPSANDQILEELKSFVSTLKKNSDGNIASSVENLKAIDRYSFQLSKWLDEKSIYSKAVKKYVDSFAKNSSLINEYFESGYINTEKGIYKAILADSETEALNSLLGSGISNNFSDAIIKSLKDSVIAGSDTKQVVQILTGYVKGDKERFGKLTRYVNQVAADAISQFNSSYMDRISRDLGLKHFYYKGTKKNDSRELCVHLAGKFFKEEELSDYITQRAITGWSGMIPGTNWSNFKIYRGGYRCSHYLLPVSETVYKARVAR